MQRNKVIKPVVWAVLLLALVIVFGCGRRARTTLGGKEITKRGMISKEELRDLLNIYRDYFISRMKQTADQLDDEVATRRVERTNLQMRSRIIGAVDAMLEPDDPVVAFLEIWGFVIRMRIYLAEGEGRNLYGDFQPVVIDFIKEVEAEIERIGHLFLNEERFEEAQKNLKRFARGNPIRGTYNNLVVLATQMHKAEAGAFVNIISAPMAPFRAMEGVDRTADAIYQIRNSIDRFTDVTQELPESTRWEAVMLMDELEESPMTQSFLTSLETFSQSTARLAESAEEMPAEVRRQIVALLEELEKTNATLNETLKLTIEASLQVGEAVDKIDGTVGSLDHTATTLNQMAVSWNQAAVSSKDLVQLFSNQKPRGPEDPPPFTMRDFDAMIVRIGQTADKINAVIAQLQNTVDSEMQEQITQSLNASIDHAAKRIFQLLLLVFVLVLTWRFIMRKRSRHVQE